MNKDELIDIFNYYIKEPKCSLNYNKDYELLIATVLSAQCTDERVNQVTKVLFDKYDLNKLSVSTPSDIIDIIRPCGNMNRKSEYIITIAKMLVDETNGIVINDRKFLESLPGVGRKVCNVILAELFGENVIAVDTHIMRVSKRLGIASKNDDPYKIEKKLNKLFKEDLANMHLRILLFGRHHCKAINPLCDGCKFSLICKYKKAKK